MKYIKLFEERVTNAHLFKKGKYVKFNDDYIKQYSEFRNDIFKIESISKTTNQAWLRNLNPGNDNHSWIFLKDLQILTELELNIIKYNI